MLKTEALVEVVQCEFSRQQEVCQSAATDCAYMPMGRLRRQGKNGGDFSHEELSFIAATRFQPRSFRGKMKPELSAGMKCETAEVTGHSLDSTWLPVLPGTLCSHFGRGCSIFNSCCLSAKQMPCTDHLSHIEEGINKNKTCLHERADFAYSILCALSGLQGKLVIAT